MNSYIRYQPLRNNYIRYQPKRKNYIRYQPLKNNYIRYGPPKAKGGKKLSVHSWSHKKIFG